MLPQLKHLLGQSILYSIGGLMVQGLGFLLLPLYTRYLSIGEYGIVGFANSLISVLGIIFSWGLQSAVMRVHVSYEKEKVELSEFVSTVLGFQILASLSLAIGFSVLGIVFPEAFFQRIAFFPYIILAIWIGFLTSTRTIPQALLRINGQPTLYSLLTVVAFIANSLVTVYLVVFRREGALGYLIGTLTASIFMAIVYAGLVLKDKLVLHFSYVKLKKVLALGLPLLPNSALLWLLNLSDRVILERFVSLDDLGVYTLGYQLALVLQGIGFASDSAWRSFYFRAAKENKNVQISRIATYYVGIMLFVGWLLIVFADDLIVLATPETYHDATTVVPWVVMGAFALILYMIWADILLFVERSSWLPIIALAASIVSITTNLLFVPRFGILAAAVSTFLSFFTLSILTFVVASYVHPLRFEYQRWLKLILVASMLGLVGIYLPTLTWWAVVIKILLLPLWPIGLSLSGFWTSEEKAFITKQITARAFHSTSFHSEK